MQKSNQTIIPIILSGGSGTRLWPISNKQNPKQYIALTGDQTIFQATIQRLQGLKNLADPIVVCNSDHRFLVAEQLKAIGIKKPNILLETVGRNTAPAIAAAAFQAIKNTQDRKGEVILLVLPADHLINNISAFHNAIIIATEQANMGNLVTFGIVPTEPHTGYGYIKADIDGNIQNSYNVKNFIEKPDQITAQKYLQEGNYLWNSGMFMFQAGSLIKELTIHANEIALTVERSVKNARKDADFIHLDAHKFETSPSVSIDCALMEKTNKAVVVPLDAGWSDIGSWSSLYDISQKDQLGNVIKGKVFTEDSINCYINSQSQTMVVIGVENLVIVNTPEGTLVISKDRAEEINRIVKKLKK